MCTSHTYIYWIFTIYTCWILLDNIAFQKKNKQTHFDRHHRIPSFHWFGDSRNINHGWWQRNLKKPCQSAKVRGFLLGCCMISLIRLLYWKSSRIHKRFGLKQDVEFLVGGLEHGFYDFPIILGISSSQLTHIFQRGRSTTIQRRSAIEPEEITISSRSQLQLAMQAAGLCGRPTFQRLDMLIRWGSALRWVKHPWVSYLIIYLICLLLET